MTNHGAIQAERLGGRFAAQGIAFTKIFSSDLQRAFKTAEAIRRAQVAKSIEVPTSIQTTQSPLLREQDFGSYEGKPVSSRIHRTKGVGSDVGHARTQEPSTFQDVESKEAMAARTDEFLDKHLLPLITGEDPAEEIVVAVVSHGILLNVLWRSLLRRFASRSVSIAPGIGPAGQVVSLEYLGGWSNTGYLKLEISKKDDHEVSSSVDVGKESFAADNLHAWQLQIKAINERGHLLDLKRTRGVGSSRLDDEQQKIDSFFKRKRVS